jgi:hypothetical protein
MRLTSQLPPVAVAVDKNGDNAEEAVAFDQGGGRRRADSGIAIAALFGDEYLAEPESRCNRTIHGQFAVRNPIEDSAIDVMTPRKSALTPFPFNCGSQKANDFAFLKYKCATARIAGRETRTFRLTQSLTAFAFRQWVAANRTVALMPQGKAKSGCPHEPQRPRLPLGDRFGMLRPGVNEVVEAVTMR